MSALRWVNALSKALNVPATRMNEIVREKRGLTAETAMLLARHCGTSKRFWLNLQAEYEPSRAEISKAEQVTREVQPRAA